MIDLPLALVQSLRAARHVAALTGAGVSAESGLPTFREAQTGLWAHYDPQELATSEAFSRDPKLVWAWYAWRRALIAAARPNPGHDALAQLARRVPRFTLITQNIDNLHQAAGSADVIELHGNIRRARCFRENTLIDDWPDTGEVPPRCPRCGAYLRPDVVWFGEALPSDQLQAAVDAAAACELFFSIGTSGLVEPAASLAGLALRRGAPVVEINPVATPLTARATFVLPAPSGEVLPALLRAVWPE